jgi:acetyl esterase/lipase
LIQVGSHELALDDAKALARHARAAGVPTTVEIYAEMPHGFIKFTGSVGTLALERVAAWDSSLAKGSA